jgi:hypothetical protein
VYVRTYTFLIGNTVVCGEPGGKDRDSPTILDSVVYTTTADVFDLAWPSRDNSDLAVAFIPPLHLQFSKVSGLRQVDNLSSFGLP